MCLHLCRIVTYVWLYGLPNGLAGKESACNAGDTGDAGLIPGLGRSPGEGRGNHSYVSFVETYSVHCSVWGFPGGSDGKESSPRCGRPGFDPWVRKISWRRQWLPAPVFLPGEFQGQSSLVGCSPWGCKESDMTEQRTCIPICTCIVYPKFLCGHIVCLQLYICIVYQSPPSTWVLPGKEAISTSRDTHYNIFELNTELKPPTNGRC